MCCDCAFVTSYELRVARFKFEGWEYAFVSCEFTTEINKFAAGRFNLDHVGSITEHTQLQIIAAV